MEGENLAKGRRLFVNASGKLKLRQSVCIHDSLSILEAIDKNRICGLLNRLEKVQLVSLYWGRA